MWFVGAITSGFKHPTDPGRLHWFRIVFGTVCTLRFALSFGQGGWDRLVPGSLSQLTPEPFHLPQPHTGEDAHHQQRSPKVMKHY
ncbi:hypothetical protein [Streptomyces sp. NPDC014676]|uniref:hypothetical protein n=1 Tax=Streptomyces sp. NPDC014676 TaxID=3364879 RepID=UPI0037026E9D